MGFRGAELLGFVLLFSCGNIGVETESPSPSPAEQVTVSSQLPSSSQAGDPLRFPVSYRLKSDQLRKRPRTHTLTNLPPESASDLTVIKLPMRGPDLNPPVRQEPKVILLEERVHVPAHSVAVHCGEREVTVEVKLNFLGNGQLIRPSDLTLGGCTSSGAADHVVLFNTELHGCSSTVKVTDDALVYSFTLIYSPTPVGSTFIFKTNSAEVGIECHYQRRQYVSSSAALRSTWTQHATDAVAEQRLGFSLRLMTEGWQSPRPSSVYFLSDVMHVEAAVLQGHHVPLRVHVDRCVATAKPDPGSDPRYPFINNHGCFTDAKLTGAKSYFLQRSQENKLHFLLKAFKFHTDQRNSMYITCHLKATMVSVPVDWQHKACSFLTEANRWVASGGDNNVCRCCESSCVEQQRRKRGLATRTGLPVLWEEETLVVGPVELQEDVLHVDLDLDQDECPSESLSLLRTHEEVHAE
ncbi:zona pellucida sperm-binding protein 3-like [Solea solea]|uniref:zona pellucida sperm-binding protein 3-like n=1 Tax=Solea solea TaxID=90069 RepID=UPI00272C9A49|nr:zona pellucida sperm-binding protein 3-like [Solea solea]